MNNRPGSHKLHVRFTATVVVLSFHAVVHASAMAPQVDEPPIWIAIGPKFLTDALGPLAKHRKSQGFEVVLAHTPVKEALASLPRRPKYPYFSPRSVAPGFVKP